MAGLKVSDFLLAARDLISEEKRWTQHRMSRLRWLGFASPSYCTMGALIETRDRCMAISGKKAKRTYGAATRALFKTLYPDWDVHFYHMGHLTHFNDTCSYKTVMELWDKTIERVQAEEASRVIANPAPVVREADQEEEEVLVG